MGLWDLRKIEKGILGVLVLRLKLQNGFSAAAMELKLWYWCVVGKCSLVMEDDEFVASREGLMKLVDGYSLISRMTQ
ncbi:hypothetical protein C5167_004208 [Papaver somniferum]|nr:hypothetical protein C5167_004208 [Papaver somniferum]